MVSSVAVTMVVSWALTKGISTLRNSLHPEAIFVIHTEFPRFIINLQDDEIEWLEVFDDYDQKVIESETENLIKEATDFYDREVARFEDD